MSVFDLFSKRQKRIRGENTDIYSYDSLPQTFRVQVVHILDEALCYKKYGYSENVKNAFSFLVKIFRKEYGVFTLPPRTNTRLGDDALEIFDFILIEADVERCIDVIEICFRYIDKMTRDFDYCGKRNSDEAANDAIEELNTRFKEAAIGYQYINGEIIRIDSDIIHSEAVKPALLMLNSPYYKGPHDEFISAYDHYRHGKNKEALNDCLKSFESTMKAIFDKRRWAYGKNDTANKLIDVCFKNGLVPEFWQTQLGALRSLLESSIPTGRNKLGGHGQGTSPIVVPDHIAAYMLHMTASTLVFLIRSEESLGK